MRFYKENSTMYKHYFHLIEKYNLPLEAYKELLIAGKELIPTKDFEHAVAKYYRVKFNADLMEPDMEILAKKSGHHKYKVCFVFMAACSKYMLEDYKRANLSEELF